MDLRMCQQFLNHQTAYCRPFTDYGKTDDSLTLDLFTDSAKNPELGCGGVCQTQWFFCQMGSSIYQEI